MLVVNFKLVLKVLTISKSFEHWNICVFSSQNSEIVEFRNFWKIIFLRNCDQQFAYFNSTWNYEIECIQGLEVCGERSGHLLDASQILSLIHFILGSIPGSKSDGNGRRIFFIENLQKSVTCLWIWSIRWLVLRNLFMLVIID